MEFPGTYTLPSFATLFNALYAAGGVNSIGSLRNIKVFRNSKEVACLDVYDYLLKGNYNANIRLENNDMIMIGPYEQLVTIHGSVKRNRIFEVKKGETLQHLLDMCGGFTGDAYTEELNLTRKIGDGYRIATVFQQNFPTFTLHDGDVVTVKGALEFYENRLTISSAAWRPGEYELTPEVNSVKKLIVKARGLKGDEFADRALITRMNEDYTTTLIPVDIRGGIMAGVIPDIALQNEDKLHISSLFDLREPYTVRIRGAVNEPGEFDYSHNMTIEDVILLAGGLKEAASVINVEVARRMKNPMSSYSNNKIAQTYSFTLSEDLIIDPDAGTVFTLQPFDEIFIRYSPEYSRQQVVQIRGEVTFVGDYVLSEKNFRLSDLINKAGGLTPDAYIKGASLKRKVTEDEQRRLETLLAMPANQSGNDSISLSTIDLEQYAVGIDLQKALSRPGSNADLVLQDGDELYIPQMQNTVKITGAVNYPNSVTFSEEASVKDYLSQSGGYLDNARKYPIVIYMNGMVATTKKKGIFFKKYPKVEPGSEIIIPERSLSGTRMSPMDIMSIASSTTSMAAMVTSIINTLSK